MMYKIYKIPTFNYRRMAIEAIKMRLILHQKKENPIGTKCFSVISLNERG